MYASRRRFEWVPTTYVFRRLKISVSQDCPDTQILILIIADVGQHSFVEIDHEIFSTVILSIPLIQEGQLSVSGERMCTILVNRLED